MKRLIYSVPHLFFVFLLISCSEVSEQEQMLNSIETPFMNEARFKELFDLQRVESYPTLSMKVTAAPRLYTGNESFTFNRTVGYIKAEGGIGGESHVISNQFDQWRTDYLYIERAQKRRGIADLAHTVDDAGRILSEARFLGFVEVAATDSTSAITFIEIEEVHYGSNGKLAFRCKSRMETFGVGRKVLESEAIGERRADYHIVWPVEAHRGRF